MGLGVALRLALKITVGQIVEQERPVGVEEFALPLAQMLLNDLALFKEPVADPVKAVFGRRAYLQVHQLGQGAVR